MCAKLVTLWTWGINIFIFKLEDYVCYLLRYLRSPYIVFSGHIFLSPVIFYCIVPLHFKSNRASVTALYLKRFLYHLTLLQQAQPGCCSSDKDYFLNYYTLIIAFTLATPMLFNQVRFNTKKKKLICQEV